MTLLELARNTEWLDIRLRYMPRYRMWEAYVQGVTWSPVLDTSPFEALERLARHMSGREINGWRVPYLDPTPNH